jgi:hypothetical protein
MWGDALYDDIIELDGRKLYVVFPSVEEQAWCRELVAIVHEVEDLIKCICGDMDVRALDVLQQVELGGTAKRAHATIQKICNLLISKFVVAVEFPDGPGCFFAFEAGEEGSLEIAAKVQISKQLVERLQLWLLAC